MQSPFTRKLWPLLKKLNNYVLQVYDRIDLQDHKQGPMFNFVSRTKQTIFEEIQEFIQELEEDAEVIELDQKTGLFELPFDRTWIVSPLEGMTNLMYQIPQLCLSISLCEYGEVQKAFIYDIIADTLYSAELGQGAFSNQSRIRCGNKVQGVLIGNETWPIVDLPGFSKLSHRYRTTGCPSLNVASVAASKMTATLGKMDYAQILSAFLIIKESGGYLKVIRDQADMGSVIHEKEIHLMEDDALLAASPKIMGMVIGKQ
jgi:myo-inositol-1(or 4)-monophosphatase